MFERIEPKDLHSKVLSVMFTDMLGFTSKTEAGSRSDLLALISTQQEYTIDIIQQHEGKLIKTIGDALLVVFESPSQALEAGLQIQKNIKKNNRYVTEESRVDMRIAICTGEVLLHDGDIYGEAVNIASRVQSQIALPGDVYFTGSTYYNMRTIPQDIKRQGLKLLRGVSVPVEVFQARPREESNHRRLLVLPTTLVSRERLQHSAPLSDRVAATAIDLFFAAFLCLMVPACIEFLPFVSKIISCVHVEAETLGRAVYHPNASGEHYLHLAANEQVSFPFTGPTGIYDITFASRSMLDSRSAGGLTIGDSYYQLAILHPHQGIFRRSPLDLRRRALTKGDRITLHGPSWDNTSFNLDYIDFIPPSSLAHRPVGVERSFRFQDLYDLVWYDDMNVHFFLARIPLFFLLLNLVFLSLTTWTPGSLAMNIRISNNQGKRLGLFFSFWRTFGLAIGIFSLGLTFLVAGLGSNKAWSDKLARSQVSKL